MREKDFFDVVELVCRKPELYTGTVSFTRVNIFLEGYALGANVGDNNHHSKFTPFFQWLVKKNGIQKSIIGWDEFREMFSSDTEALENLSLLYKEYVDNL